MNDSDTPDQSSPDSLNASSESHLNSDQELRTRSGRLSKPPQSVGTDHHVSDGHVKVGVLPERRWSWRQVY